MAIHWSAPGWLWPLLPLVAAGAVFWTAWVYGRSRPATDPGLRRLLVALRATSVVLLLAAAAAPVLSLRSRVFDPAELHVIVEDSASMAVVDAGPEGGTSRWTRAGELVAALVEAAAGRESGPQVHVWRGNGLGTLEEFAPDRPPTAVGTDLDGLLRAAARRGVGRPVRAVVLVSDGQETRRDPVAGAPTSVPGGPRLYVVGVGDPAGPPDRLLVDVRHPATVHVGDEVGLSFVIDHRGTTGVTGTANVRLEGPEGVLRDTTVTLTGPTTVVDLMFDAAAEGLQVYEVAVSPLADERFRANNRMSLAIDVRRDRQRVLLVAARPGWDTRFLAQAAGAEPRLEMVVVHGSARGLVRADSLLSWQPPQTPAAWGRWDAVVLAGWAADWSPAAWTALGEAVAAGLGLGVLAPASPRAGVAAPPPPTALATILPVTTSSWRWRQGEQSVAVGQVPGHPILAGVTRDLVRLPPVRSVLPTDPAAGARSLLVARQERRSAEETTPWLVVGRPDLGRVVWCGAPLWQLAFGELARADAPTEIGRRLLRNLLVWTAGGEQEAGLQFEAHDATFTEGERIRFTAHWRDMRGRTVREGSVALSLRRTDADGAGGGPRTYALSPSGDGTGAVTVELPPLPEGRYEASLAGEGPATIAGAATSFVVLRRTVEDTQVRRDQRALAGLARRWTGQAVPDDASALPAALTADLAQGDWTTGGETRRRRLDPWSGWPFLAAMAVLLGAEWTLRRRHGLL